MIRGVVETDPDADRLFSLAAAGDAVAWGSLLTDYWDRLCRMVAFRLDPRLRGRVDAADVVQEAYLEAADHRPDYFGRAEPVPLFLWLRGIVANKLLETHRHHLGTRMRDAGREVAIDPRAADRGGLDATSAALFAELTGHADGPGTAAAGAEVGDRLREALGAMDPIDRETLALRHFEQLTNSEAAAVLGIHENAAAKRYVRALKRLKEVLSGMPGGLTEVRP
jgi:RNA polymerase sigma-70 factor (ECF subfamily)